MKTSWKRLEDILKVSWRRFYKISSGEGVLKTSWRHIGRELQQTFARRLGRQNQETFAGLEDVFKTSLRYVLKTSWTRLHPTICKMSSRRLGRREILTLKTSSKRLEDMSWRRPQEMLGRCLEDTSWRRLDDIMEKSIFCKPIFDNSKAIQNALIRIHHFNISLILELNQHLYFKN